VEREIGTDVATRDCPTCGAKLREVASDDGSVSPERCQTCYPEKEKAVVKPGLERELSKEEK